MKKVKSVNLDSALPHRAVVGTKDATCISAVYVYVNVLHYSLAATNEVDMLEGAVLKSYVMSTRVRVEGCKDTTLKVGIAKVVRSEHTAVSNFSASSEEVSHYTVDPLCSDGVSAGELVGSEAYSVNVIVTEMLPYAHILNNGIISIFDRDKSGICLTGGVVWIILAVSNIILNELAVDTLIGYVCAVGLDVSCNCIIGFNAYGLRIIVSDGFPDTINLAVLIVSVDYDRLIVDCITSRIYGF